MLLGAHCRCSLRRVRCRAELKCAMKTAPSRLSSITVSAALSDCVSNMRFSLCGRDSGAADLIPTYLTVHGSLHCKESTSQAELHTCCQKAVSLALGRRQHQHSARCWRGERGRVCLALRHCTQHRRGRGALRCLVIRGRRAAPYGRTDRPKRWLACEGGRCDQMFSLVPLQVPRSRASEAASRLSAYERP